MDFNTRPDNLVDSSENKLSVCGVYAASPWNYKG